MRHTMNNSFTRNWLNVVFGVALVIASWLILTGRHIIHGDGVEYVLQTQAIALDGQTRSVLIISARGVDQMADVEWRVVEPFSYRTNPTGNVLFHFTNGMARLTIPVNARYPEHPAWGLISLPGLIRV